VLFHSKRINNVPAPASSTTSDKLRRCRPCHHASSTCHSCHHTIIVSTNMGNQLLIAIYIGDNYLSIRPAVFLFLVLDICRYVTVTKTKKMCSTNGLVCVLSSGLYLIRIHVFELQLFVCSTSIYRNVIHVMPTL
jgi:hypothetical protein